MLPHRLRGLSFVLGLVVVPLAAQEEAAAKRPAFPDTAAGRISRAWFEAINAGTDEAVVAFETAHRAAAQLAEKPAAQRAAAYRQIHAMCGRLTPVEVLEATATRVVTLAETEKLGMSVRCTLGFGPGASPRLVSVEVRPGGDPKALDAALAGWKDLPDLLARARKALDAPAVAAAVVVGGAIVDHAAVGVRAVGSETEVALDNRFHLGSVTKSMTATLIGRLLERGVLRLDMTLAEALPDAEMRGDYREVTLAQLLHHRAGIAPFTSDDGDGERLNALGGGDPRRQRAAFLAEVLQRAPTGPRGTHFQYSNAGYSILGHVAEVAAGETWETLLREEVFAPLGMDSADIGWPATRERPDQPRGHTGGRAVEFGEYDLGPWLAPAGNVCCSIDDFARYALFHLRGLRGEDGALEAATVQLLHTPPPQAKGEQRYAAGWLVRQDDEPIHWHNGSAGTFFAQVELAPASDRAFVIAVNAAPANAQAVVDATLKAMRERYRPAVTTPAAPSGRKDR